MIPFTGIPSAIKRSTMALLPKQVASTKLLNILGASLAKLIFAITPFNNWFASGVRLPFIQSSANSSLSFNSIAAASAANVAIILSPIASLSFSSLTN